MVNDDPASRLNDDLGAGREPAPPRAAAAPPRRAPHAPTFRPLERAECEAVLARNRVGRLAFAFHGRVDVEPLHYAYDDGWVYARTAPGHKLTTLDHSRWVAFEVDEVEDVFHWRSVVVHGAVQRLDDDETPDGRALRERATALLRAIVPETGTAADPVPNRTELIRLHASEMTGRAATPTAGDRGSR